MLAAHVGMRARAVALLLGAGFGVACRATAPAPAGDVRATPASVAAELLAADRAFSANAADKDLPTALVAMMRPDVVMQGPGAAFTSGVTSVAAALRANPANTGARASWEPVSGGVSADGTHGYTFGYMAIRDAAGASSNAKYMAYWTRADDGWRVAVYKRFRTPDTGVASPARPFLLPASLVPASRDAATMAEHRASVADAERAFARDAQTIGLEAAFARYGSPEAVNMGTARAFTFGADNIARQVGAGSAGQPSPVNWGPDTALVAPSGDLGITLGFIRQNVPAAGPNAGPPNGVPFFTIWRRASPGAPWRYVAE